MAKKYSKKKKPEPKRKKKQKKANTVKKEKKENIRANIPSKKEVKKEQNHKFLIKSGLLFDDILSKVIPLKGGKYGVLSEGGIFEIFSINNKEIKQELSFEFPGANLFCQLGNGIFIFNSFNYITFWEMEGKNMNKLGEYETSFGLVTYSMETINDNICAISGPNDIIEIIYYIKPNNIPVIYLDYQKSKPKTKKGKKTSLDLFPRGIGCLYYQKKHNRLLATHFSNILRVWNCDFKKKKFELFKEVDYITSFSGKIIHELNNKILIGGSDVITILNNDNYEIIDFVDFGNLGYDIFSMEVVNYYNFKEFVICGLRNGRLLGVDILNKKIEFNKKKINDSGKDNEMNIKDGKISFYGENIAYITKVKNTNMILVASHDHTLKLIEY